MEHACKNCGSVFQTLNKLIRHITSGVCPNQPTKEKPMTEQTIIEKVQARKADDAALQSLTNFIVRGNG